MCFVPWVSLTTAIIEFAIAILLFTYYRRSFFNRSAGIFLIILGLYQFTEYLLCTTNNPFLWAKAGFIVYSFLPAVGLYFALRYTHHHPRIYTVFLLPIAFAIYALFNEGFIIAASCQTFFVMVQSMLFPLDTHPILTMLYFVIYYVGYVIAISYILFKKYILDKDRMVKEEDWFIFLSASTTLFAAIFLVIALPAFYFQLPSIYCQFALFCAICAIIVAEIDRKRQKKMLLKRKKG